MQIYENFYHESYEMNVFLYLCGRKPKSYEKMERLIHYLWKYRFLSEENLLTTTGIPITIIDPGIHNTHAGPDFFNAKIKLGDTLWAGNVEIHTSASDWYKHGHHKDKAYNSVILHLIEKNDWEGVITQSGRIIPQVIFQVPDEIEKNYQYLLQTERSVPCLDRITEIPAIHLEAWKNSLTAERLDTKTAFIFKMLDKNGENWEEILYILLSRNFGFGINGDAFERLASNLPLKYIQKHQDNMLQVESLFFGQAGLLEDKIDDKYFLNLQEEYRFLRKKYDLYPLESYLFKRLRIRPHNFPHVKIAQLAAILCQGEHFFSKILEAKDINEYFRLFTPQVSDYWQYHYHFESSSSKKEKTLGLDALHIILINTVIPILCAYGKRKNLPDFIEHSAYLLETLPAEKNSIVFLFNMTGMKANNAAASQALIQLKKEYCEKKECLFCRIGHKLLSKP